MFEERQALVLEVRPWAVHGSGFVDVTVAFADRRVVTAQLGQESVPELLQPGEHVLVRLAMNTVVEVLRSADGSA